MGTDFLRLGNSGGGDERTSIVLRLWYNSFCSLTLASWSRVRIWDCKTVRIVLYDRDKVAYRRFK
jgi:hypothetical protein